MNKNSFVLYNDLIHTVSQLPDDTAGKLLKHILSYVNGEEVATNDILINIAFEPIKQSLIRDQEKYKARCDRNKNNGSKGGRPKKEKEEKPTKPSGLKNNQPKAKKADSDSDPDSDSVSDKYNFIKKEFKESFFQWLEYRRKRNDSPESDKEEKKIYDRLIERSGNNPEIAKQIIEISIKNKYSGFYEIGEFTEVFFVWLNYKKKKRQSYKTEDSENMAFAKLIRFSNKNIEKANEIIENAKGNNWAGFFPINNKGGNVSNFHEPKDINSIW